MPRREPLVFSLLLLGILLSALMNTSHVVGYTESISDNTGDVVHYLVSASFVYEGTVQKPEVDIVNVGASFDENTATGKLELELQRAPDNLNSSYFFGVSFSLESEDGQEELYFVATFSSVASPSNDTVISGYWTIGGGTGFITPEAQVTLIAGNKIYWAFSLPSLFPFDALSSSTYSKEFFGFSGQVLLTNGEVTEAYVDFAPDDANTLGGTDDSGDADTAPTNGDEGTGNGALSFGFLPGFFGLSLLAIIFLKREK